MREITQIGTGGTYVMNPATTPANPTTPKVFFDKPDRKNSNYYFVSYSHRDKELVYNLLSQLYDTDVNYWYDIDLDPGDIWNERVEDILRNSHCRGALVFMSINSLISNAVQQEIRLMEELSKTRDFRIVPIIMNFDTAMELILNVALQNPSFYGEQMPLFQKHTDNDIWIKYSDALPKISMLAESDNVKEGHSVNLRRSFLQEIDYVSRGGSRSFFCGLYPLEEDGVYRDIEWTLISNEGDLYYFISKYCVDFVHVSKIESTIQTIKQSMLAQPYVEDVTLISEDFLCSHKDAISYSLPTDYADRNRQQLLRLFWVLAGKGEEHGRYRLYNSQNALIKHRILEEKINAGLRLVLVINNNRIGENEHAEY
jgi:hypothetical protein